MTHLRKKYGRQFKQQAGHAASTTGREKVSAVRTAYADWKTGRVLRESGASARHGILSKHLRQKRQGEPVSRSGLSRRAACAARASCRREFCSSARSCRREKPSANGVSLRSATTSRSPEAPR